ncbi:MAG TPA: HAMP domain-containing sensor histidine kinase [Bacteroidia bacterium]|nr:HAMP domain-containing sensor histidine kinase [Bacteroidia bacterium]HRS58742.1 HAMP domain-containing sensor histidine kinase [Bacteroidia bacterium]HRU67924.1 HAMP domain-containing sensor histidine kinase [Bacteroidia bacterium]
MTEEINRLKEELKRKTEELESFVYIVSHDVKAPLRAINNLVEWIDEDLNGTTGDVRENFDLLKNRVKRIENMMNALTELSRVRRMELDMAEVNTGAMIAEILEMIPDSKKMKVETGKMPVFRTMHRKLYKVLYALIENAVIFHDKEDGHIRISCKEKEDCYVFSVKDNGPGIPEDLQGKVFTVFYTVNSKDIRETTGVGLTLAKKILDFVGGNIQLISKQGEGSEFIFTWPKELNVTN